MTKKSKLSILIMASLLVATIIILLISKVFFTKPKNTIKSDIKKVGDKSYYQIEIESPDDFTAIISTQVKSGIIEDSINLIHYDSLQKQLRNWNIKISKKKKIILDTLITIKSADALKKGIITVFSKLPYVAPQNAWFEYKNNSFVPHEAINGKQLIIGALSQFVLSAIKERKNKIILDPTVYYLKSRYKLESAETKQALKDLNKCLLASITYTLKEEELILKKEDFGNWLQLDTSMHVTINKTKAASFIRSMANKYDVVVNNITFTTSAGALKTIYGGDLGYRINHYKELTDLCNDLKNGNIITREPSYGMRGIPNGVFDTNKTYVEINISAQKLWYYKAGALIIESDIVTGNLSNGNGTPNGAYYIKYKELNATLNGPGYSTGVKYWMPFNAGIGLHDAKWRKTFGGSIYKTDGSHGCINLPFLTAQTIYNNVSLGGIVICYTD